MRKHIALITLQLTLCVAATAANFEITADAMRDIEDTTKSLDSNVALKKGKEAAEEAKQTLDFFKQVEGHYAQKGDTPDAVGFARKTSEFAAKALAAIEAQNFDEAADAVNGLTRSCKTCHDVYKKK